MINLAPTGYQIIPSTDRQEWLSSPAEMIVVVQGAYASAAAGDGAAQLCGSAGRGPGRPGRPAGCALPGRDHPQPRGPTPSGLAAKLQRLFLTRATPKWRSQRSSRRWEAALAALDAEMDAGDAGDTAVNNGTVRVRKAPAMQRRKPTPLQTARWNAVQKAFGYAWRSTNGRRPCAAHPTSRSRVWWRSPPRTWSLANTRYDT